MQQPLIRACVRLGLLLLLLSPRVLSAAEFEGVDVPKYRAVKKTCHGYPGYVVEVTADREMVGENIVVHKAADRPYGCIDDSIDPVIEVDNEGGQWFAGLSGNFLFVDDGTGTGNRQLHIYDLTRARPPFTTSYFDAMQPRVTKSDVTFLRFVRTVKSRDECPEDIRKKLESWAYDVVFLEEVRLDLKTFKVMPTGRKTCGAQE